MVASSVQLHVHESVLFVKHVALLYKDLPVNICKFCYDNNPVPA